MTTLQERTPARPSSGVVPGPRHRLVPAAGGGPGARLELDEQQRAVVEHAGGPLLVLAGPGTGKTTTLVEAIARRIEHDGTPPDQVLALTFSRKAAEQLRDRVTARIGRTTSAQLAATFHSFAYGLVRHYAPAELYDGPLRLLSAPEQDVMIQDLLTGEHAVSWPPALRAAVGTRGFAREVQAVLSRAREKGVEPADLVALAREADDPAYVAAALFFQRYLDVLDWDNAIDYADLIRRAVVFADAHRAELRARFRHVFVDEYQDTDPGQVALLRVLAGDGRDLTVVGDPHQSVYGFRGADVRGILDFPQQFRTVTGAAAPVRVLGTTRRFGPRLLRASRRVAARLPLAGGIPAAQRDAFLAPTAQASTEGTVEVHTFDTERAEVEHLADRLRRAHLEDGVDWADMAVLVRSGRTTIAPLRRALVAAGVPVEVAADDTPLVREPAVQPLLAALSAVVGRDHDDPAHPDHVDAAQAHTLLVSPLGGLDATEVRGLARALRRRDQEADSPTRPSPELLRRAVLDPALLEGLVADRGADVPGLRRALALARLLARGRQRLDEGGTPEEVLWELWQGTSWPRRMRAAAASGGTAARLAHRDLDALCALFEAAARAEEQRGHTSVESFLATLTAQRIPADTLADRGVRGSAVRLLTAHRAKGLEWRLVVVAHVQEETWPDLRRRSSILQADRIGSQGLQPPLTARELLAEERRLFYVAATRARERLLVTAVRSVDDDGEQPSRFLEELGVDVRHTSGRPRRPLSLTGLVAELRRTVADESADEGLRRAAARRLARLAQARAGGRALVPAADPATWWGTRALSQGPQPLRPVDEPIALRASALESLLTCSLRWFLEREAGGAQRSSSAQGFGLVVHALADRMARGDVPSSPEDVDALMEHVDRIWDELAFRTPWSRDREREQVRAALLRLTSWHSDPSRERQVVATEQELAASLRLPDGQPVLLQGRVDRLERDRDGNLVVVDLKTGKGIPTVAEVRSHDQLGFYQLAVDAGAADDVAPGARSGGAELVQLRNAPEGKARVQPQPPLSESPFEDGAGGSGEDASHPAADEDPTTWIEHRLMEAVAVLREERFAARPGRHCDYCPFHQVCPAKHAGTVLS